MRVFAYLAESLAGPWGWLGRWPGVTVWTCPPWHWREVRPGDLEGYDVLVFKLHGLPGQSFWYGDEWQTALGAKTVREADLEGAVAFVANCWGLGLNGEPGVMVRALLDAGATVVAGPGENYAGRVGAMGADLLGKWFVLGLWLGFGAENAFRGAKARVKLKRGLAARDAGEFRLISA